MASYSAIITSAEVIIVGGQIFKISASRFVNVSEEEINLMKENAISRNTKHAIKFEMTHFKGKGPSKRLQHLLQHSFDFVERC